MKKQFGSVIDFTFSELSTEDQKNCVKELVAVFFGEINSDLENLHLSIQVNNIQKS